MREHQSISVEHLVAIALALLTLLVFARVLELEFVNYDDPAYVTQNAQVQAGLTLKGLAWAFTAGEGGNWHPLTWLSHMLDCQLFGLKPAGHHLTNLLFHTANTVLLFSVLYLMAGAFWPSAMAATLFALHPLHVESVAWIAERKDVLSTFFWMLTLLAYWHYVKKPGFRNYGLVLLCFACGLMSKPMVVTLPFVLLLLDVWPLGRLPKRSDLRTLVMEKVPLFALALAGSLAAIHYQKGVHAVASLEVLPLKARFANALVAYSAYPGKMLWPSGLAVLYPHPGTSLPDWKVAGSALLLLAITLWALLTFKKYPSLAVGWLWYLGTLLPVIGIIQVGKQAMADRYTYLPLTGIFIMICWGIPELLAKWEKRDEVLGFASGSILLILAALSWHQIGYWQNSESLMRQAIHQTRDHYLTENNLGAALVQQGDSAGAVRHYLRALKLKPGYVSAMLNLAEAYERLGQTENAQGIYDKTLQTHPSNVLVRTKYSDFLAHQGKNTEAIRQYTEALRLAPSDARAHNNFAVLLEKMGHRLQAIEHYREALRIKPAYAEAHYNLGLAWHRQGQMEKAAAQYREALRLRPDYLEAHINLGSIYLQRKRPAEAIRQYQKALQRKPNHAGAHYSLGLAHQFEGELEKAAAQYREALRIQPDFQPAREKLRQLERSRKSD